MKKEILNCIEKYRVLRTFLTTLVYMEINNNWAEKRPSNMRKCADSDHPDAQSIIRAFVLHSYIL